MSLPRLLPSGLFPLQSVHAGPFLYGSNVYAVLLNTPGVTTVTVVRSTDPVNVAFTQLDTANQPSLASGSIRSLYANQQSTKLHVGWWDDSGNLYYSRFDTSTETWDAIGMNHKEAVVALGSPPPFDYVHVQVRSDGTPFILTAGTTETIKGTTYRRAHLYRRTGPGAWNDTTLFSGTASNASAGGLYLGSSDRLHAFYDVASTSLRMKTLSAANVLSAEHTLTAGIFGDETMVAAPQPLISSGTTYVRGVYPPSSFTSTKPNVAFFDSTSDDPTPGTETTTTAVEDVGSSGVTTHVVPWGDDWLWVGADPVNGGTFFRQRTKASTSFASATVVHIANGGLTIAFRGAATYVRAGDLRLAWMYTDANGQWYDEYPRPMTAGGWSVGKVRIG